MKLITRILDLIYPPRCVFCHEFLEKGEGPVCRKCDGTQAGPLDSELDMEITDVDRTIAPLFYKADVRLSLLRYKFKGLRQYSETYGKLLSKAIDEKQISCDIITWVPLSKKRLRKRGYDQARLIAEAAGANLGIPCVRLLKKVKNNPAQSGTGGPDKRKANVKGVYMAACPEETRDKQILIIDDIVTTGATLAECAGVLRKAGAQSICAAAVARSFK